MTNSEIIALLKDYRAHLLKLGSHREYDYQKTRTYLNKNRQIVQRILITAKTLRAISVAPPPITGGYVMNNVNPLDLIFDPPYGLDIYSHLSDVIEQTIGIIEADPDFASRLAHKPKDEKEYDVWGLIHPAIAEISKKRMKDGYYADAVESACKALNSRVRGIVLDHIGEELDGAGLMHKAFSPNNPIIILESQDSISGRDTQRGYMDIYAGVMTGIRNPKAHENDNITKDDALRKLVLISLLMFKIDGRIIND